MKRHTAFATALLATLLLLAPAESKAFCCGFFGGGFSFGFGFGGGSSWWGGPGWWGPGYWYRPYYGYYYRPWYWGYPYGGYPYWGYPYGGFPYYGLIPRYLYVPQGVAPVVTPPQASQEK